MYFRRRRWSALPVAHAARADHVESRALGGGDETSNLRVRCRAHNRLHAEQVFGSEHVKRRIDERQRASRRRQERTAAGGSRAGARRDAAEETTADLCIRGLTNMDFAAAKARRFVTSLHPAT